MLTGCTSDIGGWNSGPRGTASRLGCSSAVFTAGSSAQTDVVVDETEARTDAGGDVDVEMGERGDREAGGEVSGEVGEEADVEVSDGGLPDISSL